ncbi:hypothetical protein V5O48_002377 [Marasmius crinis-equi]|uniref:Uncharacterized protein n=1 Tax=Marasmius crinis-equi TaxID=585013 RepID=A0ABR3FVS8_9AGAR
MSFSLEEVASHNKPTSCWVIINQHVYDVTDFLLVYSNLDFCRNVGANSLQEHPGGSSIILKYAGRDATRAYEPIHPKDALEKHLPKSKHLGPVADEAAQKLKEAEAKRQKKQDELRVEKALKERPLLSRILNLDDMEAVAKKVLPFKVYSFYSAGADDGITLDQNARAYSRFFFNPRVMKPVSKCDLSTTILGFQSGLPIFVCGAALAKLGHPLGEVNITRACGKAKLVQMISTHCSCSYSEIADTALPDQPLFFQLYKSSNDAKAAMLVKEVERLGYKSIWLTVDVTSLGNREKDVKSGWVLEDQENGVSPVYVEEVAKGGEESVNFFGTSNPIVALDDRDMTWTKVGVGTSCCAHSERFEQTIPWLRSVTKLPIVLKDHQGFKALRCGNASEIFDAKVKYAL